MGNWIMIIEGSGVHDNGKASDAEVMLRGFVTRMRHQGQKIEKADFMVTGSRHNCERPFLGHEAVKE